MNPIRRADKPSEEELENELLQTYENEFGVPSTIERLRQYSLDKRERFHQMIRLEKAQDLSEEEWNDSLAEVNRIYNSLGANWGCEEEKEEEEEAIGQESEGDDEDDGYESAEINGTVVGCYLLRKREGTTVRMDTRSLHSQKKAAPKKAAPFKIPKTKAWTELRWADGRYNTYRSSEMKFTRISEMRKNAKWQKQFAHQDYSCVLIGFGSTKEKAQELGETHWKKLSKQQRQAILYRLSKMND